MKKRINKLAYWFAGLLNSLSASLESMGNTAVTQSKFVNLAPTDQADGAGVYSEALFFAADDEKVRNIALTGPYGSGKSSIIQSFLKQYRRPALHISLAAFVPEAGTVDNKENRQKAELDGNNVSRQEIERSILQQMVYGADANKLPLSRFKRIQSPGVWSAFKSLFIMLGLLALWYVFLQREAIVSGDFFIPFTLSNWFNLGSFALGAIFLWMTLHHFYVASFGLSLKSLSLKDIQIRPTSDMRLNADQVEDFFDGFGEKGELARFLILEGHLDDTYYQYTSLFHSGRLSPNDNKFLIQIRAYFTPEPDFPIDNPKEVIAAMREEDFRQGYVLNVKLVDCLLSDRDRYGAQTQKLFEFLSSEFESCESFFDAYYASGREVSELLSALADAWERFVTTAIASPRNMTHITQLIANVPDSSLKALANDFGELSEFVSANLPEILVRAPELAPERLESIGFEVKDLASIQENPGILRFMFEKGLFELTIANLEYIYQEILGENDLTPLRARNYTTLRSKNDAVLLKRVERDFELYLQDVLLELEGNSEEDALAIVAILRCDGLDQDDLRAFLERQTTLLPTLDDVPVGLHEMLFQTNGIKPTWENCTTFMEGDGYEAESLITYLDRDDVRATIVQRPILSDTDTLPIRKFLIEAATLRDTAYREYIQALPTSFEKFPDVLEQSKLQILIEEKKVTFTKDSLDALVQYASLQILFAATNVEEYLTNPDAFALDDDFREKLLETDISDKNKRAIIDLIDLNALSELPERAALVGPILVRTDAKISNIDANIARSLILNSEPTTTQIALLNEVHSTFTDDEARQLLTDLPRPYSEIRKGYNTPRLTNTAEHLALVKWLDSRNIISSWNDGGWFTDDILVNLYRR